jgi:bacillithiol biosynthesis cysteine-adding enzyme BshC
VSRAESLPVSAIPGFHRLFIDFCSGSPALTGWYAELPPAAGWQQRPPVPAHQTELVSLLAAQNPEPQAKPALAALADGAGVTVTGQQVGLFGGPLFTPLKAATAVARARQATQAGYPHAAIFWLASEDHDFAEINHVVLPAGRELRQLTYTSAPAAEVPVGALLLDSTILPLVDQAADLLGPSEALDALAAAYQPGRTLAQAFRDFYARIFAAHGLLILDPSVREAHRLGAPVLLAALERADELHQALVARNQELTAAGYHVQVAVLDRSSLLFLIDEKTGARLALKRTPSTAAKPAGLWQAGRQNYSTAELAAILAAQPERISPSALLRPVFQDFLLGTSLTIGGPAEIAYFAQSAVLFERILGRLTPSQPRFSATLVEPAMADLLRIHDLSPERVFAETPDSLRQLLATRALPAEGRAHLEVAGRALETELGPLIDWMELVDAGLGRSARTSASKMRYQMGRLRRLAANFALEKEASLGRHAQALSTALYPHGGLQERLHGAAYYLARYGSPLVADMVDQAAKFTTGHTELWL